MAWVTRWRWPAPPAGRHLGEVEPLGLELRPARPSASSSARRAARARLERVAHPVEGAADLPAAVVVEPAELSP